MSDHQLPEEDAATYSRTAIVVAAAVSLGELVVAHLRTPPRPPRR